MRSDKLEMESLKRPALVKDTKVRVGHINGSRCGDSIFSQE